MLLPIGYQATVCTNRIVSILPYGSAPIKRMIEEAYEEKKTINATKNKATRSVIITDSNHVILSAIEPNTLKRRLEEGLGR